MKPYTKALVWSCALITALAVLFVYSQPASAAMLAALNVLPQPERFTELYFDLPLPQRIEQGAVAFSFSVGDHEDHAMQYDYLVYVQSPQGAQMLGSGSLELQDGQSQAVEQSYDVGSLQSGEFFVQLPQLGEQIHFSLLPQ